MIEKKRQKPEQVTLFDLPVLPDSVDSLPRKPSLFLKMVRSYLKLGRYEEAIELHKASLKLFPEDGNFHAEFARLCQSSKQLAIAETIYRNSIEIVTEKMELYIGFGKLLRKLDRHKDAVEIYERAVELRPHPWLYLYLAWSLEKISDFPQALVACRKAADGAGKNPNLLLQLVRTFERLGVPGDAERILRANMYHLSADTSFRLVFARVLERQGKIKEAEDVYREGLSIFPGDSVLDTEFAHFRQRTGTCDLASIFLSHSHADKSFVNRLSQDLAKLGIRVWIDEAEIEIGDSLIEKIREGIDRVDYVGVIVSKASVASEWVKKEMDIAMNHEIEGKRVKVLPLLVDDCDLPGFLKGKLYADFRKTESYDAEFRKLARRLGVTGEREL